MLLGAYLQRGSKKFRKMFGTRKVEDQKLSGGEVS
jgi:hypothetical protein